MVRLFSVSNNIPNDDESGSNRTRSVESCLLYFFKRTEDILPPFFETVARRRSFSIVKSWSESLAAEANTSYLFANATARAESLTLPDGAWIIEAGSLPTTD